MSGATNPVGTNRRGAWPERPAPKAQERES